MAALWTAEDFSFAQRSYPPMLYRNDIVFVNFLVVARFDLSDQDKITYSGVS